MDKGRKGVALIQQCGSHQCLGSSFEERKGRQSRPYYLILASNFPVHLFSSSRIPRTSRKTGVLRP